MRKLHLVAILALHCAPAGASSFDAASLVNAANEASLLGRTINETRKYCASNYPDSKRLLDYYSVLWADNNEVDITSAEDIIARQGKAEFYKAQESLFSTRMQQIRADRKPNDRQSYCSSFLDGLSKGAEDISKAAPKAHLILKAYSDQHPTGDATTAADSMMGCIKQSFNREIDLDVAVSNCECMTTAMYKNFSVKELEEYDRVARAGGNVPGATRNVSDLPQFQRIKPILQQCPAVHLEMPSTGFLGRPW